MHILIIYHILGLQDGKIVHVENEFRDAYSKIVLPILNADLKKSEGEQAEKESLAIALDFLSSQVSKGTSSKCPVEAYSIAKRCCAEMSGTRAHRDCSAWRL